MNFREPDTDCPLCPRLGAFRREWRSREPGWFNAPVPSFGPVDAQLLVVGLAPGLRGANKSGRPFTGDGAGDFLYPTLIESGFARGQYCARADDGLKLVNCRITNAVRCVPPQNRPLGAEFKSCNVFLEREIGFLAHLDTVLALGGMAHQAILDALGVRRSTFRFAHGEVHQPVEGLRLVDSYHCSRLNTNTGRLTKAMFRAVFDTIIANPAMDGAG